MAEINHRQYCGINTVAGMVKMKLEWKTTATQTNFIYLFLITNEFHDEYFSFVL